MVARRALQHTEKTRESDGVISGAYGEWDKFSEWKARNLLFSTARAIRGLAISRWRIALFRFAKPTSELAILFLHWITRNAANDSIERGEESYGDVNLLLRNVACASKNITHAVRAIRRRIVCWFVLFSCSNLRRCEPKVWNFISWFSTV